MFSYKAQNEPHTNMWEKKHNRNSSRHIKTKSDKADTCFQYFSPKETEKGKQITNT